MIIRDVPQKTCRAMLGLGGSETRSYMGGGDSKYRPKTRTPRRSSLCLGSFHFRAMNFRPLELEARGRAGVLHATHSSDQV
jgi:hypothetical protein